MASFESGSEHGVKALLGVMLQLILTSIQRWYNSFQPRSCSGCGPLPPAIVDLDEFKRWLPSAVFIRPLQMKSGEFSARGIGRVCGDWSSPVRSNGSTRRSSRSANSILDRSAYSTLPDIGLTVVGSMQTRILGLLDPMPCSGESGRDGTALQFTNGTMTDPCLGLNELRNMVAFHGVHDWRPAGSQHVSFAVASRGVRAIRPRSVSNLIASRTIVVLDG
jgi:hypothetical protein